MRAIRAFEETNLLILTRKPGERVRIGEDIVVTVFGVNGNQVRIGVDAPRAVEVHREEIYERIRSEQKVEKNSQGAQ